MAAYLTVHMHHARGDTSAVNVEGWSPTCGTLRVYDSLFFDHNHLWLQLAFKMVCYMHVSFPTTVLRCYMYVYRQCDKAQHSTTRSHDLLQRVRTITTASHYSCYVPAILLTPPPTLEKNSCLLHHALHEHLPRSYG